MSYLNILKRLDDLIFTGEPKPKQLNAFLFSLTDSMTVTWSFKCSVAVSLDRLWQEDRRSVNVVVLCFLWPAKEGEFLYWLDRNPK